MRTINLIPFLAAVALGACKSEDSPAPSTPTPSTGRFVAATVEGLRYECGDLSGVTNANGEYQYYPGEPIEFLVGKASIGAGPAAARMTLLDLVNGLDSRDGEMINRAKFLQSIDQDGKLVNGITISDDVEKLVDRAMDDLGIDAINFGDDGEVNRVTFRVFVWATDLPGHALDLVDGVSAQQSMDRLLVDENLFRARLSREAALDSARPNLLIARHLIGPVGEGTTTLSTRQLVATWSEEVARSDARDAYAAVSLDDGKNWNTYNLSRSALKSSYTTKDGRDLPGDTGPVAAAIADDRFVAAWSSRYCPSADPLDLKIDKYGAVGPQGAPAVPLGANEAPFACVWAIRGQITHEGLHLRFPEQLTSGVRDATQVRITGADGVGFTVAWTEDPNGGAGFPSQGTDVWMTELRWNDVLTTAGPYERLPIVKFAPPVRLSDNAACRYEPFQPGREVNPSHDWLSAHQTEGYPYCNDVSVAIGKDGYGLMADGVLLNGLPGAGELRLAMAREPRIDDAGSTPSLGHTLIAWEERRGSHLEGSDVRVHTMASFADDAVVGGSVVNRPDRIGMNPVLVAQDVGELGASGTRYVVGYMEADGLFPAESAVMMRYARDGFDANALGQPIQVAVADGYAKLWSLALRGENVAASYTAGDGNGTRNAYVRVSTDGGTSFKRDPVDMSQLGAGTVDAFDPKVVWSTEAHPMLFATYGTRDGNLPGDLFYARSADLGTTFDTVPVIDPETGTTREVFDHLAQAWADERDARIVVAPDGDDLYAIWLQEARMQSDIWFRPIAY